MMYDYNFYHKRCLMKKSVNYEKELNFTEKELLMLDLLLGNIEDYGEVDWRWLKEDICGNTEEFADKIVMREEKVRVLSYLRDNCRECLFDASYPEEEILAFEDECVRLIWKALRERKNDPVIEGMDPDPDLLSIAVTHRKERELTEKEKIIFKRIPRFLIVWTAVSRVILFELAYAVQAYIKEEPKRHQEEGDEDWIKPNEMAMALYDQIQKKANKRLWQNYNPVYQTLFIVVCLIGASDDATEREKEFAKEVMDYIDKKKDFKGLDVRRTAELVINELKELEDEEKNNVTDSALPIPRPKDYIGTMLYIETRRKSDAEFSEYCRTHNRVELCERLTKEFGWEVDAHSLGVSIGRGQRRR